MSTIMIPSQRFITIHITDPVTKKVLPRNVQDRTIMQYRNTGSVLVHTPSDAAAGAAPVVFESYGDLEAYHREGYVYQLVSRPSYHLSTFAVALAVLGDSAEPFTAFEDIMPDFREYYTLLSDAERSEVTRQWRDIGPMKRVGFITCRYDCLLKNKAASGFVSSLPGPITEDAVRDMHDRCHYAHFLSYTIRCQKSQKRWKEFFTRPTHMYLGGQLPAEAAAAASVLDVSRSLGVKLFVKSGLRYAAWR